MLRAALGGGRRGLSGWAVRWAAADVLGATDGRVAALGADQLAVEVKATLVQAEDVRQLRGISLGAVGDVAGTSGVGVVAAVPSGEGDFRVGDRVLVVGDGAWSSTVVAAKTSVVKIGNLPFEQAALLPSFVSAWALLNDFATVGKGDTVLEKTDNTFHSSAIAQLGKHRGIDVVSLTADDISKRQEQIRKSEGKESAYKAKLAISSTGCISSGHLFKWLAYGGTLVLHNGDLTRDEDRALELPVSAAIFSNVKVAGFDLRRWVESNPSGYRTAVQSVVDLISSQQLDVKNTKLFKASAIKDALAAVSAATDRNAVVIQF